MDLAALERFIVTARSRTEGRFLGGHSASIDGWEYHDSNTGVSLTSRAESTSLSLAVTRCVPFSTTAV